MNYFRTRRRMWIYGAVILLGAATAGCDAKPGTPNEPVTVDQEPAQDFQAAITSFVADPTQVSLGESSTLGWSASAQTCTVSPELGTLSAMEGTASVSPATTTTYILTCLAGTSEPITAWTVVEVTEVTIAPDQEPEEVIDLIVDAHIFGLLSYDSVPSSGDGLNYAAVVERPIRGARVALIQVNDGTVVAEAISRQDGAYDLTATVTGLARVRVYAQTVTPSIVIEDNTSGNAMYALDSSVFQPLSSHPLSLHAASGWGGSSYTAARSAAPFTILDAAYTSAWSFLDVRAATFEPLHINWSESNRPSNTYNVATGEISTSHWDGNELYILGKADVDTDEFDTHIIVHEWGHYFESTLGRSDSLGGSHSAGDILDPAVAFGEGWGNALSAMVLYPNAVYSDTYGGDQTLGFEIDMDDNVGEDPVPGWFSEASVQSILYDLFDAGVEPWDTVALGLGPLYDVMVGAQKVTPTRTTIFSFIHGLRQAQTAVTEAIDLLTSQHQMGPVLDAYATGETNDGGFAGSLPVYVWVAIDGGAQVVDFLASEEPNANYNKLTSVRNLRFVGDGRTVTVQSTATADVDLVLLRSGVPLAEAVSYSGNESLTDIVTQNGVEYVINVVGYLDALAPGPDAYSASIAVVSQ